MTECHKLSGLKRGICIGALDRLITLKSRDIQAPGGDSVDYSEDFVSLVDVWAKVGTLAKGPVFVDGTNIARQATHVFGIRYFDNINSETWVELAGVNYDVLNIENLEERDEWLFLYAMKRGDKTILVNQL